MALATAPQRTCNHEGLLILLARRALFSTSRCFLHLLKRFPALACDPRREAAVLSVSLPVALPSTKASFPVPAVPRETASSTLLLSLPESLASLPPLSLQASSPPSSSSELLPTLAALPPPTLEASPTPPLRSAASCCSSLASSCPPTTSPEKRFNPERILDMAAATAAIHMPARRPSR